MREGPGSLGLVVLCIAYTFMQNAVLYAECGLLGIACYILCVVGSCTHIYICILYKKNVPSHSLSSTDKK